MRRFDPYGAALLLVGGMCLIPFLQPRHMPPLRTFYDEWLAFALGLTALAFTATASRHKTVRVPVPALFLALFAFTLVARAFGHQSAYPQSPLLWGLYLMFAALVLVLGRMLVVQFGRERVCDVLAVFLLAGALANSVCVALQTTGIPLSLSAFVAHRQGMRPTGNLGQANLLANYVALGEASLVYLYARGKLGALSAFACGLVLVLCAALAASRASLLYAACFAVLGWLVLRVRKEAPARRLGIAALVLAVCMALGQWIVPAGIGAIGYSVEGGIFRTMPADWDGPLPDEAANLRLSAWSLAIKLFLNAPWAGVGPDEFAGAAFMHGLPAELAANQLWTSPHNLFFHLLAETGLVGALLVAAAMLTWLHGAWSEFARVRDASMWWLLACTGVGFLHALLEYPLWYAHFLAVTALLMGMSSTGGFAIRPTSLRAVFGLSAAAGAIVLAISLDAYIRFDLASPVAAGRSLASDSAIERDRESLAELGHGLLAPRAETWLFLSFPLDDSDLSRKIEVGRRAMRLWPSREVIGRQAIFLALAGRDSEAVGLLELGLRTFPTRRRVFSEMIESAPPRAREILRTGMRDHHRPMPQAPTPNTAGRLPAS